MLLKLTIQQAEALYNLFVSEVLPTPATDVAESLVKDLITQVFKKLRSKLESKLKGRGYSISLTDVEAKAYYVYFNSRNFGTQWLYEQTFISNQINELNKRYA
ncbi:hypothetical protein [Mucilaginibacter kameinonensis]|uniref:hypothetical protein n=1 Tax=Mucilaginibacter kameinonensis TaxID=452286 RepID=UPI000EF83C79|nr:hypothetical protein [Mucilaginibacter kameinonensis]